LPSWHYDEASSFNTPGSDPDDGSGWYVLEYTNRVDFSAWRWKLDGDWTHADQQWMIYEGYETWSIGTIASQMIYESRGRIVPPDCTIIYLGPQTTEGSEDATNITWTSTCVYRNDVSGDITVTNLYIEAIRDKTVTPIKTGRGVPRAARLTPELQAGILSTFAGYAERQYYAIQGQTNGWEQGESFPNINKKRFRFDPYETVSTNVTTNISWRAETNFGAINDAAIEFRHVYPESNSHWFIWYFGQQAAQKIGLEYYGIYPDFVYGNGDETKLENIQTQIKYYSGTNTVYTNLTFTATRTDYVTTNEVITYDSEFSYHPTNRKIRTRRLVDFNNFDRLSDFMLDWSQYGFVNSSSYRPSTKTVVLYDTPSSTTTSVVDYLTWHYGQMNDVSPSGDGYNRPNMFWSSTEGHVFDGTRLVPAFNWVRDPTANTSLWAKCCQTFRCLDYDEVWYRNYYEEDYPDTFAMPSSLLLKNVSFGLYQYENHEDLCRPSKIDCTMRQLIEKNFPHADGWAITNMTRRLISDRICCLNQALGLMDRTFHVPEIKYPKSSTNITPLVSNGVFVPVTNVVCVATNFHYVNAVGYNGSIRPSSVNYPYYDDSIRIEFGCNEIEWSDEWSTNYVSSSDKPHVENYLIKEVSPSLTTASFSGGFGNDVEPYIVSEQDLRTLFQDIDDGDYQFDVFPQSGIYYYDEESSNVFGRVKVDLWKDGSYLSSYYFNHFVIHIQNSFSQSYSYERSYYYQKTMTFPTLGITQPGWESGHTSDMKYGAILGLEMTTNAPGLNYTSYKSYTGAYSSRYNLESAFEDIVDDAYQRFNVIYGLDPMSWRNVIPIDNNDVMFVRNSITNSYYTITVSGGTTTTHGQITASNGNLTFVDVFSVSWSDVQQYRIFDGWGANLMPVVQKHFTMEYPKQKDSDLLQMKAKIGIVTKVDWDFKTLKRE